MPTDKYLEILRGSAGAQVELLKKIYEGGQFLGDPVGRGWSDLGRPCRQAPAGMHGWEPCSALSPERAFGKGGPGGGCQHCAGAHYSQSCTPPIPLLLKRHRK